MCWWPRPQTRRAGQWRGALKLLLRRIAVHFEDIADAHALSKTEAPLVELANRAREGDRAAVDVLAFLTMYAMAPGSG